jgi:hypothetical protein
MPGSQRNTWNSYLNGGTSHYNFSYKDEIPPEPEPTLNQTPIPQPVAPPPPSKPTSLPSIPNTPPQPSMPPAANKKKQSGGKRKSRRHSKKYRYSRRK